MLVDRSADACARRCTASSWWSRLGRVDRGSRRAHCRRSAVRVGAAGPALSHARSQRRGGRTPVERTADRARAAAPDLDRRDVRVAQRIPAPIFVTRASQASSRPQGTHRRQRLRRRGARHRRGGIIVGRPGNGAGTAGVRRTRRCCRCAPAGRFRRTPMPRCAPVSRWRRRSSSRLTAGPGVQPEPQRASRPPARRLIERAAERDLVVIGAVDPARPTGAFRRLTRA